LNPDSYKYLHKPQQIKVLPELLFVEVISIAFFIVSYNIL